MTESDYSDDDEEEDYGDYYGDDLSYSDEINSGTDRHVLLVNAVGADGDRDRSGGDSNE